MSRTSGMGGHHSNNPDKDEWLTPPEIIKSLGEFDLDPCAPINRPWATAKKHYTVEDNGLMQNWSGRVWLNPPYGKHTGAWLDKMVLHGQGIALIFARTETEMFFHYVWEKADAVLFLKSRLHFYHSSGERAKHNAGAPSCLVAFGKKEAETLKNTDLKGKFIDLKRNQDD